MNDFEKQKIWWLHNRKKYRASDVIPDLLVMTCPLPESQRIFDVELWL